MVFAFAVKRLTYVHVSVKRMYVHTTKGLDSVSFALLQIPIVARLSMFTNTVNVGPLVPCFRVGGSGRRLWGGVTQMYGEHFVSIEVSCVVCMSVLALQLVWA